MRMRTALPFRLIALLFLLSGANSATAADKLKVAAFDLPPYISAEAEKGGPVLEILDRILNQLNIPYQVDFLPNKRAIQSVMQGDHDMVALVPMVGGHAVQLEFSDVLVVSKNYVFHLKDGPVYDGNLKQLANKRIGSLQALQHDQDFQDFAAGGNLSLVESRNPLTILKLLRLQRVDVAVMPEDVGRWAAVADPDAFRQVERSEHYMDISHLAMGMNWESPFADYLWDINAQVDDMKRSGALRLILESGISRFLAAQRDE